MRRRGAIYSLLVLVDAGLVLPAAINAATSGFPASWHSHLWLGWPVAVILAGPVIRWQRRRNPEPLATVASNEPPVEGTYWNIAAPLRTFVDRGDEMIRIADRIVEGPVALFGLSGVGKTQLARAYARASRTQFDIGWMINASSRLAIETSLAKLADRLGLDVDDQRVAAAAVIEHLNQRNDWLLIFDNAPSELVLGTFIPAGSGQVLITSRNPNLSHVAEAIEVKPFDIETATRYLLGRVGDGDTQSAAELSERVDGLPLALDQAASYCISVGRSTASYLSLYRANMRRTLMRADAPPEKKAAAVTFSLAYRKACRRDCAAGELLVLIAFVAPTAGFSIEMFLTNPRVLPRSLAAAAANPAKRDAAVRVLHEMSLLTGADGQHRTHALVQDSVRDVVTANAVTRIWRRLWTLGHSLDPSGGWGIDRWIDVISAQMVAGGPTNDDNQHERERAAQWLPHARTVIDFAMRRERPTLPSAALMLTVAQYLEHRGDREEACHLFGSAITIYRKRLGDHHRLTLQSISQHGTAT